MDINNLLKSIKNLNEYISASQRRCDVRKTKVQFNLSTIIAIKKIRSFEIEYFNKCQENGIAVSSVESILKEPTSNTWEVLGKELVSLLQYWLDALRKHLISHNPLWWTFLEVILNFIKIIHQKHTSMPNILVQLTAEGLLDLSTHEKAVIQQKMIILDCLNMYSAESNREIRFAMRNKFGNYFVKLSSIMACCGHFPCQRHIVETLIRWLVPRHDRFLRSASARKWFPSELYPQEAVAIFLERQWHNFCQDARDFLNAHNQAKDLIVSIVCKKFSIGDIAILTDIEKQMSWLDINTVGNCISFSLDTNMLEKFGRQNHMYWETLIISEENVRSIQLHSESQEITITVKMNTAAQTFPSKFKITDGDTTDMSIVVSSRSDLRRLDKALKATFVDKYLLMLDLDQERAFSPQASREQDPKETDADALRFSHPVEKRRKTRISYAIKKNSASWKSPSSASTSSLAHLHEKLAALPQYNFDKESVAVCVRPQLSSVTELTESDTTHFNSASTFKITSNKRHGVSYMKHNVIRTSQSDKEDKRHTTDKSLEKDNSVSCLLVATIGSSDDDVINKTIDRISKRNDYDPANIIDLLVKEALQGKTTETNNNLGNTLNITHNINNQEEQNSEVVENSLPTAVKATKKKQSQKHCTIISKSSSTNESYKDVIFETPIDCVNTRVRRSKKEVYDEEEINDFFSRHITENKTGDVTISPTLARKINLSSSDTNEDFEEFHVNEVSNQNTVFTFDYTEVVEILNGVIDKVCNNDFRNSLEFDSTKNIKDLCIKNKKDIEMSQSKKNLRFSENKAVTSKENAVNSQNNLSSKTKKAPIDFKNKKEKSIEEANIDKSPENEVHKEKSVESRNVVTNFKTNRRRRKLYSPKNEENNKNISDKPVSVVADSLVLSYHENKSNPQYSTITPYKDIVKERQNYVRQPRNRRTKTTLGKQQSSYVNKFEVAFDELKKTDNYNEDVLLENQAPVHIYDFTSSSEDDDFVTKKSFKRKSPVECYISQMSTKRGRKTNRVNYKENISNEKKIHKKTEKNNKISIKAKGKSKRRKTSVPKNDLIDQRIRQSTTELLNTSFIAETPNELGNKEPDPLLTKTSQVEEYTLSSKDIDNNSKKGHKKKLPVKSAKNTKNSSEKLVDNKTNDKTLSPLPELLLEPTPVHNENSDTLAREEMLQALKQVYLNQSKEGDQNEHNLDNNSQINIHANDNSKCKPLKHSNGSNKAKISSNNNRNSNEIENCFSIVSTSDGNREQIANIFSSSVDNNGHGDFNESPPNINQINEKVSPRNLELDRLDKSLQGYLNTLANKLNPSDEKFESSTNLSEERRKSRNPFETLSKMSLDNVLPLMKSNEKIINRHSSALDKIFGQKTETRGPYRKGSVDKERILRDSKKQKKRSISNSPSIDNSSVLSEDGRKFKYNEHQWLPSSHSFSSESEDLNIRKTGSTTNPRQVISIVDMSIEDLGKGEENKKETTIITHENKHVSNQSDDLIPKNDATVKRSVISPIDLNKFDFITKSQNKPRQPASHSSLKHEINKVCSVILERTNESSLKKRKTDIPEIEEIPRKCPKTSTESSKMSSKITILPKTKAIQDTASSVSGTAGASRSSVNEWFIRNESASNNDEAAKSAMVETFQSILEKLNTSIAETNLNTGRKFLNLLIETENDLQKNCEEVRDSLKDGAKKVITGFCSIMDEVFADVDKRFQERNNHIKEQLKSRGMLFLLNDSRQKQAVVKILKEDTEAVINYLKRDKTS